MNRPQRWQRCCALMRATRRAFFQADVAYFLLGVKGWKFDHSTFRLTPVLLDGSDGPVAELREMYDSFSARNDD
jgi:hypothetical protein